MPLFCGKRTGKKLGNGDPKEISPFVDICVSCKLMQCKLDHCNHSYVKRTKVCKWKLNRKVNLSGSTVITNVNLFSINTCSSYPL